MSIEVGFYLCVAQIRADFSEKVEVLWYNPWTVAAWVVPVLIGILFGLVRRIWLRSFFAGFVSCWFFGTLACNYVLVRMHDIPINKDEMFAIAGDSGLSMAAFGFAPLRAISFCSLLFLGMWVLRWCWDLKIKGVKRSKGSKDQRGQKIKGVKRSKGSKDQRGQVS